MGNIYEYAGSNELGLTYCSPLQKDGEQVGALCSDIKSGAYLNHDSFHHTISGGSCLPTEVKDLLYKKFLLLPNDEQQIQNADEESIAEWLGINLNTSQ